MTVRDEGEGRHRLGDDQVGLLADSDRTEDVAHSHCIGGVDGAGIEGLLWSQSHPDASESHYETHVAAWTRAGIVVGCESHRKSCFYVAFCIAERNSEEERTARKHCRHGHAATKSLDLCISSLFKMVHRKCTVFHTDLHAT